MFQHEFFLWLNLFRDPVEADYVDSMQEAEELARVVMHQLVRLVDNFLIVVVWNETEAAVVRHDVLSCSSPQWCKEFAVTGF